MGLLWHHLERVQHSITRGCEANNVADFRAEVRGAVETHRASQREEVRREETVAGRRLTAAELAELREQVRQQWAPRSEQVPKVPPPAEDRGTATAHGTLVPAARLQRP